LRFIAEPAETNTDPEERFQLMNDSLHDWVNTERFHTFMKITRGNLYQVFASNKFLVLAVVEENKLQDVPSHMIESVY
jgi:thioredoxin domain-containing protein 10